MQALPPPPRPGREKFALFLDIDGTLAEFADQPGDVGPESQRTEILRRLRERLAGGVAVLSGRRLSDIDFILEGVIRPAAAVHGLIHRHPDGAVEAMASRGSLDAVCPLLHAFAAERSGVVLEDKDLSLAVHYRRTPQAAGEVDALTRSVSCKHRLVRQRGAMVVELRPRGADKGSALRRFLRHPQFAGRVPVMVGDDLTDEHAFKAASAAHGFGVLVGAPRRTAARFSLPSVSAVLDWLANT